MLALMNSETPQKKAKPSIAIRTQKKANLALQALAEGIVQVERTPPRILPSSPARHHGLECQQSAIKRASSDITPRFPHRAKKPKVEEALVTIDPAIIAAMRSVDCNDLSPQPTQPCPEACGFGRNRVCSIRKSAKLTSYIMVINGSDASTRQQLCQLTDKQCR